MVAEMAVSAEWQPLNEQERAVVTALSQRLAGFDTVAPDLLVAFVRGHLTDGVDTTEQLLRKCLEWRALPEVQADSATLKPLSGRRAFEAMYQAGPVGRDAEGRAIVMERVGALPMASLCQLRPLDEEALIRHYLYTKEACRTLCRELSHAAGRRVYKAVMIVDLCGLSLSHTKPSALRLFQLLIAKFQDSYPEFMVATYVINAPALFTGLVSLTLSLSLSLSQSLSLSLSLSRTPTPTSVRAARPRITASGARRHLDPRSAPPLALRPSGGTGRLEPPAHGAG